MRQILILLLVCGAANLLAAYGPITGLVLDAETREPLPFANIVVQGQHRGTVSNSEGHFVLDMEGISPAATISISYVGYESLKISAGELQNLTSVYLRPAAVNLRTVEVYANSLTAEKIIALVRKNYEKNYPVALGRRRIFYHKYEKTPFPEENQIVLKKADFVGLDRETFDALFQKLPREFTEYQDAVVDLYSEEDSHSLIPIEGISLEESGMQDLSREMESKLGEFFSDIEKTSANSDVYYKFRTGIVAIKAGKGNNSDSIWSQQKKDTLHYLVKTELVRNEITDLFASYSSIDSKNWEFINHTSKYEYTLAGVTVLNEEPVYEISFVPKKKGLFTGLMYVSTVTYAVLQLDFEFAPGKRSEDFHMLGFGHSMTYKKGRVIFERGEVGYHVKYIYAQQHETASIERDFTIMKKQKRFLVDKELSEIKLQAQLFFDTESFREILVQEREETDPRRLAMTKEPAITRFRKEYVYSPGMWLNSTMIAPTAELKKYKRR